MVVPGGCSGNVLQGLLLPKVDAKSTSVGAFSISWVYYFSLISDVDDPALNFRAHDVVSAGATNQPSTFQPILLLLLRIVFERNTFSSLHWIPESRGNVSPLCEKTLITVKRCSLLGQPYVQRPYNPHQPSCGIGVTYNVRFSPSIVSATTATDLQSSSIVVVVTPLTNIKILHNATANSLDWKEQVEGHDHRFGWVP